MRLESIDLKGVLRFPNRIALDLSSLSGLVAIVGANGEGKTSLLEAFPGTLYRQLPSRAERELFDYAHDRDSYLQASFTMGTRRFRARVALDAVSRKSEAVLLETLPDGSERVLSDGKVSTYDAAIKANLPPQSVLLASAFASQNRRGSFVTLDRKGRRALFAELLGLEFYEAMAVTSRAAANLIEQGRTKLAGRREAVAAACAPAVETDIARRAKAEAVALEDTKDEQTALTSTIVALEAEEVTARAAANRYRQALDGQRAAHDAIRQIEQRIANVDQQQTAAREQQTREIARTRCSTS
jgi:DNA repair exonuclease SbcCD ATPase subunit